MAKVYRHQGKYWQACVTANGLRKRRNFATQAEARAWARQIEAALLGVHAPKLGGPAKVNVAGLLHAYAHEYTLHKAGWAQELSRINRYLTAVGSRPLVPVDPNDSRRGFRPAGDSELPDAADAALPRTFREHREHRAQRRAATNAVRERLARTPCNRVSRADIREFITVMTRDGLSASSVQKEVALLKHAFGVARSEWDWVAFDNPCSGVKLPRPDPPRDVSLSAEDEAALRAALAECANPLMLVYFDLAVQTTARRGSLLRLAWSDIDLERRTALLRRTKNGRNVVVPLTQRAVDVLKQAKAQGRGRRVFDLTEEALGAAWGRAVQRAGLPHLRVHDLRHIGTTRLASRLPNTQMLKALTGHRSDAMLARYVHFAPKDVLPFLDATEPSLPEQASRQPLPPAAAPQAAGTGAGNVIPLRPGQYGGSKPRRDATGPRSDDKAAPHTIDGPRRVGRDPSATLTEEPPSRRHAPPGLRNAAPTQNHAAAGRGSRKAAPQPPDAVGKTAATGALRAIQAPPQLSDGTA